MTKYLWFIVLLVFLLSGCYKTAPESATPTGSHSIPVGVVLSDYHTRFDWGVMDEEQTGYIETALEGKKLILYADREASYHAENLVSIVQPMSAYGTLFIFVPEDTPESVMSNLQNTYPAIVFLKQTDRGRGDVETFMANLADNADDGSENGIINEAGREVTTDTEKSNPDVLTIVILVIVAFFLAVILVGEFLLRKMSGVSFVEVFLIMMKGEDRKRFDKPGKAKGLIGRRRQTEKIASEYKSEYEEIGKRPPLLQHLFTYVHGDEHFDESVNITLKDGSFYGLYLGECGMSVARVLDDSQPRRAMAFDIWAFDVPADNIPGTKPEPEDTITAILMSHYLYNNVAWREEVMADSRRQEIIQPDLDATGVLKGASFLVQIRVLDMQYLEQANVPTGAVFDKLVIEVSVWPRAPY